MLKSKYYVIGVMSGTSLDGLDFAYVEFNFNSSWSFKIIKAETIEYSKEWKNILKNLVSNTLEELHKIDKNYTSYLGFTINEFIKRNNILELDAVCSHGHTALHQPEKGLTYQIGNQKQLSKLIGKTVVCNFRVQDVELGGQGAPLVPIGDKLLFSKYDYCINLGGFANISTDIYKQRIAYDICPVNIVLNDYASKLGLDYDCNGDLAASGNINEALLSKLNNLEFYKLNPPKSLGLEWVRKTIFPLIKAYNLKIEDILRTFVEHIACQITREINTSRNTSVLITGGGVYNLFLMDRIKALTDNTIIIPSKKIIEYKEALIFGLLGVLKLRNEDNCLSSVTGASKNHSSGNIFHP
ncbi:MAG: anhydro-N-acetylmuramic acid kinase [Flavobacteriaceae bacterium]|nr:anhydro-N-acetylmuramic acid kinase [Flavobacteriaceae bacterium]